MKGSVYIVEAENGLFKIGWSSNPQHRANCIATGSPLLVRLIAVLDGGCADERGLQREFERYVSHREWFRIEGDAARFIEDVRGEGVEAVPSWDDVRKISIFRKSQTTKARMSEAHRKNWADPSWRASRLASVVRRPAKTAEAQA